MLADAARSVHAMASALRAQIGEMCIGCACSSTNTGHQTMAHRSMQYVHGALLPMRRGWFALATDGYSGITAVRARAGSHLCSHTRNGGCQRGEFECGPQGRSKHIDQDEARGANDILSLSHLSWTIRV